MTVTEQSENSSSSSFSSITRRDDDILFTTERSNMDYVTLSGVCKRTGAEEPELPVFLLEQLIDNGLDSAESYASPTSVTGSYDVTATTNKNVQTNHVDGIPVLQIKESLRIPSESLLLKRYFGLETEWDDPANNIVGPKETEIEFDKILGQDKPRTKAKVCRPTIKLSQDVIPLAHSSNSNNYPVVAVKFGRGFLIHTGMSLDEEREYETLARS